MSKKNKRRNDVSPRDAIANAAVKLFSDRGYNGTTMRDLAQEVGTLAGSLYAHIDSKETLLVEIVQNGIERFLAIVRRLEDSTDPAEVKLRAAIIAHMAVVAENPKRTLVVFHQWRFLSEPNRMKAVAMRRSYAQTFMKIVDEGIACGDFSPKLDTRIAVFGILGALNWTPEWYSPDGPASAEKLGDLLAESLIGGLRDAPRRAPGSMDEKGKKPPQAPPSRAPAKRALAKSPMKKPPAAKTRHGAAQGK